MKTQQDIRRETVGEFIRHYREKSGKTQSEIARSLNYSAPQFVSNWERGVALPPTNDTRSVARLIGVAFADLLKRMEQCEVQEARLKYQIVKRTAR